MAKANFKIPYPKTADGKRAWNARFGLNAYYSGKHWSKRDADAKYWHSMVRHELKAQRIRSVPFDKPVEIHFYWNDNLDLSNHAVMAKMIEDALKGILIRDDSRAYVVGHSHHWHDGDFIGVGVKEI